VTTITYRNYPVTETVPAKIQILLSVKTCFHTPMTIWAVGLLSRTACSTSKTSKSDSNNILCNDGSSNHLAFGVFRVRCDGKNNCPSRQHDKGLFGILDRRTTSRKD
jgi:hypothetical protein